MIERRLVLNLIQANTLKKDQSKIICHQVNSLPNDKISKWSKFKASADDNLNAVQMMGSVSKKYENKVGKGENTGYQHLLLYPLCFPKPFMLGSLTHSHTTKFWTIPN